MTAWVEVMFQGIRLATSTTSCRPTACCTVRKAIHLAKPATRVPTGDPTPRPKWLGTGLDRKHCGPQKLAQNWHTGTVNPVSSDHLQSTKSCC